MIFFIHVGKTAGSTMNNYLASNYPLGFDHCEAFINDDAVLADRLRRANWMSGHVTLPATLQRLAPLRSDIRWFTCVREPEAQVRSHYNWLIEIFHKGRRFYDGHPQLVKDISEQIRQTAANPTPAGVARDLRTSAGLFLNYQSRFFFGNDLKRLKAAAAAGTPLGDMPAVVRSTEKFDAIADSAAIERLFNHIHGADVYTPDNRLKVNTSTYRIDPELFKSDEVRETLRQHNLLDELLYAHLAKSMVDGLLVNRTRPAAMATAASDPRHG